MHYVDLLTPDYDPWAGFEWPDKAGQLERAPRKRKAGAAEPAEAADPPPNERA